MAEKPQFEVWLAYSDRHISVPSDKCTLDVLIEAGVPIEPGCRTGSCGECVTEYVEGDIQHQDGCLTPGERERLFCPCVSRVRGRLVLPF